MCGKGLTCDHLRQFDFTIIKNFLKKFHTGTGIILTQFVLYYDYFLKFSMETNIFFTSS